MATQQDCLQVPKSNSECSLFDKQMQDIPLGTGIPTDKWTVYCVAHSLQDGCLSKIHTFCRECDTTGSPGVPVVNGMLQTHVFLSLVAPEQDQMTTYTSTQTI